MFFALPLSVGWSKQPRGYTLGKWNLSRLPSGKGPGMSLGLPKGGGSKCVVNVKMLRQYPEMCLVQS